MKIVVEALRSLAILLLVMLALALLGFAVCGVAHAAPNFRVVTRTPNAAAYVKRAEYCYKTQSKFWFGKEHPALYPLKGNVPPVPIYVTEGVRSHGVTRFATQDKKVVFGWRMNVAGSRDEILNNVLPHEVCHVVMQSALPNGIPPLFAEGAATLMEGDESRANYYQTGISHRGPPLRQIMDRSTPTDHAAYSQAHVIVRYMVAKWGPEKFIAFLRDRRKPSAKLKEFYGLTPEQLEAAAFKPAARKSRKEVIVFCGKDCPPCKRWKADRAAGRFKGQRFRVVEYGSKEFRALAVECRKMTGKDPTKAVPVFWCYKTTKVTVGYSGPEDFARWLLTLPFRIVAGIVKAFQPPDDAGFATQDTGIFDPDFSGVRVIVAPHQRELPAAGGAILGLAERAASPALQRIVRDVTKGKGVLVFVPERAFPKRYAALAKALGREQGQDLVAVIVPKTSQGVTRGLAVSIGEKIAKGKLANAPVDVIFERTDPNVVAAIGGALAVVEDTPTPTVSVPAPETFKGEAEKRLAALIRANVPAVPLVDNDAVAKAAADQVVERTEPFIPDWAKTALLILANAIGLAGGWQAFRAKAAAVKSGEVKWEQVLSSVSSSLSSLAQQQPPEAQQPPQSTVPQSSSTPSVSPPAEAPPNASEDAPTKSTTAA